MQAIRDGKKITITEIISKFLDIKNCSKDHNNCGIIVYVLYALDDATLQLHIFRKLDPFYFEAFSTLIEKTHRGFKNHQ